MLEIRLEHRQIYQAIAVIQAHLTASKMRVIQEIQSLQHPTEAKS